MKHLLFVLAITCCSFFTYSQDQSAREVPDAVVDGLTKTFAGASDMRWSKLGNNYEVRFEVGRNSYKAIVDESGTVIKYKKQISVSEIPAAVMSKINQLSKDQKIENVEKVVIDDDVYYQMRLEGKNFFARMVYSANGEPNRVNYWF